MWIKAYFAASIQDYKIQPHDIIKLGRVKFRVKEFKTDLDLFDSSAQPIEDNFEIQGPIDEFDETVAVEIAPP